MFDEKEIEELYDEFLNLDGKIFPDLDEDDIGKLEIDVMNVNFMKKLPTLKNNNFICDNSGVSFNNSNTDTELDLLNENFIGLNGFEYNKNSENAADLRATRNKPVFSASSLDKKEDEFDNEFKEIDEKLTSPDTSVGKNSLTRNGWAPDALGLWHSGPSSLNLGQPNNNHVLHQDLTSSVSYNSYEPPSQSAFSSSSKRTYSHQQLGAKVEMVYSLLSMLDTDNREDMSKTFLAMSSSAESCHAMRQSGCLPLLIQLIHSSELDKEVRKRAAEALHNIVHAQTDEKRRRREVRILKLLQQVREYSDELKSSCEQETTPLEESEKHPVNAIGTLMKFSFDAEHRQGICILGGLHAIAELIQVDYEAHGSTNDDVLCITLRRYAGMSLTNLTFGDGKNKALLCSFNKFMCALVDQLKSPSEDLRQVTASVLRNLSWRADSESKQALRNVGAVTALTVSAMEAKKESTLKSILSALWNLSAHCSLNKIDICSVPGALAFLVKMLRYKSSSNTLAIVENAGGILRNISSHIAVREDYRQILRENNCFEVLLEQLKSPSLTIVSNACGTLWNLSARCPEDQKRLWEMGATTMLRSLVQSKHKMISMGSSAALKNLLAANPSENLLTHLDSTAKSLGLQNLPTLFVRKKKALEQELNITLAETCENIDPVGSPTHPKPPQGELSEKKTYGPRRSDSRDSVQSTQSDSTYERLNQIAIKNEEKLLENKNVTLHESLDEKSMPRKIEDQKLMKRYKTSMIPTPKFKKLTQDRLNEKTREETLLEDNMNEPIEAELKNNAKPKKAIPVLSTRLKSKINENHENVGDSFLSQSNEEFFVKNEVSENKPEACHSVEEKFLARICPEFLKQEKNNYESSRDCTSYSSLNDKNLCNGNSYKEVRTQCSNIEENINKNKELAIEDCKIVNIQYFDSSKSHDFVKNQLPLQETSLPADFEDCQKENEPETPELPNLDCLNLLEEPEIEKASQFGFSCQNTEKNKGELFQGSSTEEIRVLREKPSHVSPATSTNLLPESKLEDKASESQDKRLSFFQTDKADSTTYASTIKSPESKLASECEPLKSSVDEKTNSVLPKFKVGSPIMDSRVLQIEANKICREIKKQQDLEMGCSLTSEISLISCSSFLDTGDYSLFESSADGVDFDDSENLILRMASSKVKNFPSRKPAHSLTAESVSLPSLGSLKNEQIEALDLDNSVLSVASITSEIADTFTKEPDVLDSVTKTYKVDAQNDFIEDTAADITLVEDETLNADSLQNDPELLDEDCSLHSQENLPLDTEPTGDRLKKKLTPKEKRKTFHERYRTYTIRDVHGCKNLPFIANHGSSDLAEDCSPHSIQQCNSCNWDELQNINERQPFDSSTFVRSNKHESLKFSKSLDKERDLIPDHTVDSRSLNDLLTIGPAERKELVDNAKLVAFSLKTAVHEPETTSDSETEELPKSLDIDTATYSKSLRDRTFGKYSSPEIQNLQYYEEPVTEDFGKKGAKVLRPTDKPNEKLEELSKVIRGKRKPLYSSPQKHPMRAYDLSNSPKSKMAVEAKKTVLESPVLQREGTFTKEDGPDLKKGESKRTIPVLYRNRESKNVSSRPLNKSKSGPNVANLKRQGETQTSRIGRPLSSYASKSNERRNETDSSQRRPFSAGPTNRTGGDSAMATKRPISTGLSSPKMRNSSSNQSIKAGSSPGSKTRSSLQSSKSQSDASLNLVSFKDKVPAGKQKPAKKEVTSKIASLWRKVEESKQKNQNVKDNRVWIGPEKTKNGSSAEEVLVIEQEEIVDIPSRKIVHSFTCQALADDVHTQFDSQEGDPRYSRKLVEGADDRRVSTERRNIISAIVPPYNYSPPAPGQVNTTNIKQVDTFHKGSLKVTTV